MNAMTCPEVEAHLDLFAAGECADPTRRDIERHLEQCATCAASFAESQRLLGLLDRHWDEAGPRRLRERIEREARRLRTRHVVLPFVRRATAVAALLFVSLGLSLWMPRWGTRENTPDLQLAALEVPVGREAKMEAMTAVRAPGGRADFKRQDADAVLRISLPGAGGAAYRHALRQAQRERTLPQPTAVPLAFELRNADDRSLLLRLGDPASELSLEVYGQGVLRLPAAGSELPPLLRPRVLRLASDSAYRFRMDRLIAGRPGQLNYIYLTEPGDYTLTARLRITVNGAPAVLTSNTLHLRVDR